MPSFSTECSAEEICGAAAATGAATTRIASASEGLAMFPPRDASYCTVRKRTCGEGSDFGLNTVPNRFRRGLKDSWFSDRKRATSRNPLHPTEGGPLMRRAFLGIVPALSLVLASFGARADDGGNAAAKLDGEIRSLVQKVDPARIQANINALSAFH